MTSRVLFIILSTLAKSGMVGGWGGEFMAPVTPSPQVARALGDYNYRSNFWQTGNTDNIYLFYSIILYGLILIAL